MSLSNAVCWQKVVLFWFQFHWNLFLGIELAINMSALVQITTWCHQVPSYYLNQCLPRSMTPWCNQASISWTVNIYNDKNGHKIQLLFINSVLSKLSVSFSPISLRVITLLLGQSCISFSVHWNENVVILTKFSSLAALEIVILTTSSATCHENFIKMTTFSFHCSDMQIILKGWIHPIWIDNWLWHQNKDCVYCMHIWWHVLYVFTSDNTG